MPNYSDIQKAVRVEKTQLWFGWLASNIIMAIIANATRNIAIVSAITQILAVAVFAALTFALFRMTGRLNRRAKQARGEVLGEDYPA